MPGSILYAVNLHPAPAAVLRCLLVFCLATPASAADAPAATRPAGVVEDTLAARLGPAGEARSISISPDGRHVAVLHRRDGKQFVSLDGTPGAAYDWIVPTSLRFTGDSAHVLYIVQGAEGMAVVVDGKAGKWYHEILGSEVRTAPQGNRYAYYARAAAEAKPVAVIDGIETRAYDEVGSLHFSLDGQHLAFGVQLNNRQFFIIDGQPGTFFEKVAGPSFAFSADGKRHAYGAVREGKIVLVIDGREEPPAEETSRPIFSPDGTHVAYAARRGGRWAAVLDRMAQREYDRIAADTLRFSPDSQRLTYLASEKREVDAKAVGVVFHVVDGQELPAFGQIRGPLVYSPDSKRTAFLGIREGKLIPVIDGREKGAYDDVRLLQFSPDSQRWACLARTGRGIHRVVDGTEGPPYDSIANLLFSPVGGRMAMVAAQKRAALLVVDGQAERACDGIVAETVSFSPDGRHIACEAQKGDQKLILIDGSESTAHEGTLSGSRLLWVTPQRLQALVVRGEEIRRLVIAP